MKYSFQAIRPWLNERGVDVQGHCTSDKIVAAIEDSTGKNQREFRCFRLFLTKRFTAITLPIQTVLRQLSESGVS